jgi:predicted flavoprotein YhiN
VPGLHIAGEALDVIGPCGGYNLHFAFTTGYLAGRAY